MKYLGFVFSIPEQITNVAEAFPRGERGISSKTLAACWLVLSLMLFAGHVRAQEPRQTDLNGMSIEELAKLKVDSVYGASRFLQKAADAPASVTVITAEEIHKYGYRTLADVLRTVRGFYVIYDRNYSYVGVRGLARPGDYNAGILFLLDGHRENDNIYDGAYVATEVPVDVDLIERIEIIRGPNSSIYGTGAFAAVINVITKRGRDLSASEVSTEAGSWNSYKGRVSFGDRFDNGLETLVSGSIYTSMGNKRLFYPEFDSPATNNGFAIDADGDQSFNLFADIIYRDFNIHVVHGSRTKHIPTASYGTVFNDSRTRTTDTRGYADVQYSHTFGKWAALGRLSYDWYDYHGIYVYDYAGTGIPPFTQNYDAANGTWLDFQSDASRVFFQHHHVTLGMEWRKDLQQQQVNYDIQPYLLYLEDHRSALVWSFYFQDEYSVRKNLAFTLGLRDDWHDKFGNTLSPRVGLLLRPKRNTDVRAIYSWAFRAPNSYENFYAGNGNSSANLSLRPELIRTWELDVEHRFGKTYRVSGAAFLNRIDNLIDHTLDPLTGAHVYTNSVPLETKGIEWEVGAKWTSGLEGTISHSLQGSRNIVTGEVRTNSPKQLVKVNLSVPLVHRKLFASVDAQYTSRRRTIAQTDLGGFFVLNVTLFARRFKEDFDVSAGLYNLFDKRYADSGGLEHVETSIPQDGRSFRVKLNYRPRWRSKEKGKNFSE